MKVRHYFKDGRRWKSRFTEQRNFRQEANSVFTNDDAPVDVAVASPARTIPLSLLERMKRVDPTMVRRYHQKSGE